MYIDGIKLFIKNEKELETLTQTVRIYSEDTAIEFDIKSAMLMIEGIKPPNQEKSERTEKGKITNIWEYRKRTPSNMRRWKKNEKQRKEKNTSGERENNPRPNYTAKISSKG